MSEDTTVFPVGIDPMPSVGPFDLIEADLTNLTSSAIVAIEESLGTLPFGPYLSIKLALAGKIDNNYGSATLSSGVYSLTTTPTPTAYAAGLQVRFVAGSANTGSVSLNVNSLGAVAIKKQGGNNLVSNDIVAGQAVTVVYDGTYFQMMSPATTATTVGDLLYGGTGGTLTRLAGNTSTTRKFLSEVGDGTDAAAPTWEALQASDIPTLTHSKISDFDTQVRTSRLDQMAPPTAAVSLNGNRLTNVADPSAGTDAVNSQTMVQTIQNEAVSYALDTGAVNAYAIALSPTPAAYIEGMRVVFMPLHTNTGASTLNVNSLGTKALKRVGGEAVTAGDIQVGGPVVAIYTGDDFRMQTPSGVANPMTILADMIVGGTDGVPTRMGGNVSTTRKFLRAVGNGSSAQAPAWDTLQAGDIPNPLTTLGDTIYGETGGVQTRLPGNTSTTRKFLRDVGDGSAAQAPAWDTLQAGDIPNPLTTLGDTIYGATGGVQTRLPGNASTTRKFLRDVGDGSSADAPGWDTLQSGDIPTLTHAKISDFDSQVNTHTVNDLAAPTADFSMSSHKITDLTDPTAAQHAATKNYVDSVAQGLTPKSAARFATAAALATYTPSGNVLTATANGALVIDGATIPANARVVVKNESGGNQKYNGMYDVTQQGDGSNPWILTRSSDMNSDAEIAGASAFVEEGTTNATTLWVISTPPPITLGTTALTWTQMAGPGAYTAGSNISITGTQIALASSPALAGTPTAPTPSGSDNSTKIATTAWVTAHYTSPMTTTGDLVYSSDNAGTAARLSGNTSTTRKFLREVGDGTAAAAPAWDTLQAGDIPTLLHTKISDFDAQVRTSALNQMAIPSADLSMNSHALTNLSDPVNPQDAATRSFVESLTFKAAVRVATTAALSTYSVSGNTLTASANGALSVDSQTVSLNDRILVRNESNAQYNGIYKVTQVGDGSHPWILARTPDMSSSSQVPGAAVYVREGGSGGSGGNAYRLWVVTGATSSFTLNTTAMTWNDLVSLHAVNTWAARVSTVTTLPSYTSPSNNVLTASSNGALTVDGVSVDVGDRVLVTRETGSNEKYNGMYRVTAVGSAGAPWSMSRTLDMNTSSKVIGSTFYVCEGTAFATLWGNTNTGSFTLNTTGMTWAQLAGPPRSDVDFNGQRATNLADPTGSTDAVTMGWFGAALDGVTNDHGDVTFTGSLTAVGADFGDAAVSNVGDAAAAGDAVNVEVLQTSQTQYAAGGGTTDAYTATLSPAPAALVAGLLLYVKIPASATNTGACTLNVNGLGATSIKTQSGANPGAGAVTAGGIYGLIYDGTNFQML